MKNPIRTTTSAVTALGAGVALALVPALTASAHVGASAEVTAAGASTVVTFSVPHGCSGSPTTEIEIGIPSSITSVTPTINPGWTVRKSMVFIDPADDSGVPAERVESVTYTAIGEGLPDGYRDTFELSLRLPEGEPGDVLAFPTLQSCAEGSENWAGDDAPTIVLTAADADAGGHGHGHDSAPVDPDAPATSEPAEGSTEEAAAPNTPDAQPQPDVLARVFGVLGLAVGAVGIVLAVVARRGRGSAES